MITSFGRGSDFHIGAAFSGENVGLREVEPGRWLITFMSLDLGYVDQKTKKLDSLIYKSVTHVPFKKLLPIFFVAHSKQQK
ncbi:MAG: hypothetical protein ABH859_01175 [Pseudomonadota bacterium]